MVIFFSSYPNLKRKSLRPNQHRCATLYTSNNVLAGAFISLIMANEENIALRHRFELLKGAEHHKNALIEVLGRQHLGIGLMI